MPVFSAIFLPRSIPQPAKYAGHSFYFFHHRKRKQKVESTFIQPPVVSGFELLARSLAAFFNRHHVTVTTKLNLVVQCLSCASLYLPSSDECALKRVLTVNVIYSLGKKDYILSLNLLSRALGSISLCHSYSSIINLLQIYVLLLYFQKDFTS